MPVSIPVTQRDVAQACGLHPSTVCLALKNSPSIPAETRRRIQAVAEELGYHPNVAARNLAMLRTEKKAGGSLPIVWLNQEARRDHWRVDPEARTYLNGAKRRAEELGYHIEEIWTQEPGMSAGRIIQIIAARGIEGVLFPAHRTIDFSLLNQAWTDFALAGFNDLRLGECVDLVAPDYFRNTQSILRRLRQLDFRRIGLVMTADMDAATNGLVHGCYLRHQAERPISERMPVCYAADGGENGYGVLTKWMRENRPDVVLCSSSELAEWARGVGFSMPWVQIHGALDGFDAGVDVRPAEIAAATVECLVEKMRRFEKGVGNSPRFHLLSGVWQEGALADREMVTSVA